MSEEQKARVLENKMARMKLIQDTITVLTTLGETVPKSVYEEMEKAVLELDKASKEMFA